MRARRPMLHTTLALLRQHDACVDRYHLRKVLGPEYEDETPIPLLRILEINGFDDALWALRAVPPEQGALRDRVTRLLAADYAEHVLPHFESTYPSDTRPRDCIETARRYAHGSATDNELQTAAWAAWAARAVAEAEARAAARAVAEARAAAWAAAAAAWAAWAARAAWAAWAARAAARAEAWAVAWAAARAVAEAEARAAAWAAAEAEAAEAAERAWQFQRLREYLETTDAPR